MTIPLQARSRGSEKLPFKEQEPEFGICRVELLCRKATYHIDGSRINPFPSESRSLPADTVFASEFALGDLQPPNVDRPTGTPLVWSTSTTGLRHSAEARHEVPSV